MGKLTNILLLFEKLSNPLVNRIFCDRHPRYAHHTQRKLIWFFHRTLGNSSPSKSLPYVIVMHCSREYIRVSYKSSERHCSGSAHVACSRDEKNVLENGSLNAFNYIHPVYF